MLHANSQLTVSESNDVMYMHCYGFAVRTVEEEAVRHDLPHLGSSKSVGTILSAVLSIHYLRYVHWLLRW